MFSDKILPLIRRPGDAWDGRLHVNVDSSPVAAADSIAAVVDGDRDQFCEQVSTGAIGFYHPTIWDGNAGPDYIGLVREFMVTPQSFMAWHQSWMAASFYRHRVLTWMHSVMVGMRFADRTRNHHVIGLGHSPMIGMPYGSPSDVPAIVEPGSMFSYFFHVPKEGPPKLVSCTFTPYVPSES
ncbi:hypothetical protein HON52_04120 [Candidatus Uhrbacteria bacterium]|nr:hypothetical protein [Candidatus Uhrbacteria bacterium]